MASGAVDEHRPARDGFLEPPRRKPPGGVVIAHHGPVEIRHDEDARLGNQARPFGIRAYAGASCDTMDGPVGIAGTLDPPGVVGARVGGEGETVRVGGRARLPTRGR